MIVNTAMYKTTNKAEKIIQVIEAFTQGNRIKKV
jgi:hypothetical protein